MKTITSILGRSAGGISIQPFIGKSESGEKFYLKPCGSRADGLVAEFIGSSLARDMGLPVADFEIVSIPEKLAKHSLRPEFAELSSGPAFASRALSNDYIDLTPDQHSNLHEQQLSELYLFDYWIQNSDRILGEQAGNPNALCSVVTGQLAIIDHDSAFAPDFTATEHQNIHFAAAQKNWWQNSERQAAWTEKISFVLENNLQSYWKQIPEEWPQNQFGDSRITTSAAAIEETLKLPLLDKENFWSHYTDK